MYIILILVFRHDTLFWWLYFSICLCVTKKMIKRATFTFVFNGIFIKKSQFVRSQKKIPDRTGPDRTNSDFSGNIPDRTNFVRLRYIYRTGQKLSGPVRSGTVDKYDV